MDSKQGDRLELGDPLPDSEAPATASSGTQTEGPADLDHQEQTVSNISIIANKFQKQSDNNKESVVQERIPQEPSSLAATSDINMKINRNNKLSTTISIINNNKKSPPPPPKSPTTTTQLYNANIGILNNKNQESPDNNHQKPKSSIINLANIHQQFDMINNHHNLAHESNRTILKILNNNTNIEHSAYGNPNETMNETSINHYGSIHHHNQNQNNHNNINYNNNLQGATNDDNPSRSNTNANTNQDYDVASTGCCRPLNIGAGLTNDLRRRANYYISDFTDGFRGHRSFYKTCSTTIFLYFSVLLPCIAFGVVDTNNTNGQIDPKKTMIGQAIGGAIFAIVSGQPLIVIMTTAPLCIYVKVIYQISEDLNVDFALYYACVGLWMSLFLIIFSLINLSNLMKYCTRSTEDIFAIFTAFAFGSDGVKEAFRSFNRYYWNPECVHDGGGHSTTTSHTTNVLDHQPQFHLMSVNNSILNTNFHNESTLHALQPTSKSISNQSPFQATTEHNMNTNPSIHHDLNHFNNSNIDSVTMNEQDMSYPSRCQRETCILFLFLMFGTLWLANSFSGFDKTPYLSSRKREIIKDYALAISVLLFSFVGSYVFMDIHLDVFEFSEFGGIHLVQFGNGQLTAKVIISASYLGFMLSVLFYIDQNICGAMVHNAPYRLKKGDYFHLDLFVLALLNSVLCIFGLPFMHGKLPHSHLHSKALADYEEHITEGHIQANIVSIRETRLTQLFCSVLIAFSLLAVPYPIAYIPLPVLSGVFLYTALAEFKSNSMADRICLMFTEATVYPSNHYSRRVPRYKIHLFTAAQIIQLGIVSLIGFYPNPYVNMAFPLAIAFFIPFRALILPLVIQSKYLQILDKT